MIGRRHIEICIWLALNVQPLTALDPVLGLAGLFISTAISKHMMEFISHLMMSSLINHGMNHGWLRAYFIGLSYYCDRKADRANSCEHCNATFAKCCPVWSRYQVDDHHSTAQQGLSISHNIINYITM